ncbi:hypothetical protein BDW59DRAFT_21011 [Aspergillus cavernicola]|uniref:Alpha-ketoglutarate-dependent sulfonate dioxygenase n=1 Tax=Aspergillus cavernicola TaxID=176166 RepID=A0ABR4HIH8_9EURO
MGLSSTAANTERENSGNNPPTYTQNPEQPPMVPTLYLDQGSGPAKYTTVTYSECIVHLKFLAALSDLRDTVTSIPNLFDIPDPSAQEFDSYINEAWALVKEKRWTVYTAKAVERYSLWWNACVPASRRRPTTSLIYSAEYDNISACNSSMIWARDELPPLDILMVWHAHMLNPRSFLEDCIRHGKISFWSGGFPWEAINASIDDQTLVYEAGMQAARAFLSTTDLKWDNFQDLPMKTLRCPVCSHLNSAPWTTGKLTLPLHQTFSNWHGFTDKNFKISCAQCQLAITHATLRVQKFRTDVEGLLDDNLPMPGTIFNLWGVPQRQSRKSRGQQEVDFPNRLIQAARGDIRQYMKSQMWITPSVGMLRNSLESLMRDWGVMKNANSTATSPTNLQKQEKVAFRRMMSRYWDNSSQFALDLVGAVVRQGTFIQKMDNIDWLHSPTVTETMQRLIRKYVVFFQIMSSNPDRMAVPTLDVDLAWHTHQLSPGRYFEYSTHRTAQDGKYAIFIDHDDKVSEIKLSDGFEWTSKIYRKLTDGGIYSECTCWYCEAIRAPDLHTRIILFPSSSSAKARVAAAKLHDNPAISSHPDKNPHISAHSAVKANDPRATFKGVSPYYVKFLKLCSEYEKSRRRAIKRSNKNNKNNHDGKLDEKERSSKDGNKGYGVYSMYPLMWGYPLYVPYYGPYTSDPSVHSDVYAANPGCMSLQDGDPGNCAAGTCGGGVAAGACGGMGGGCTSKSGCAGGGSSCAGSSSGDGGGSGCGGGGGGDSGGGCGGGG